MNSSDKLYAPRAPARTTNAGTWVVFELGESSSTLLLIRSLVAGTSVVEGEMVVGAGEDR